MVAGEVRSPAQRSANAAKEIKGLIGDTVARVDNGTTLVGRAGQTMEEIVQAVKRVTDIMGEISAASAEQSSGIEQVNRAVAQMDEVTQQNAALVEEAAAAPDRSKTVQAAWARRWPPSASACRPRRGRSAPGAPSLRCGRPPRRPEPRRPEPRRRRMRRLRAGACRGAAPRAAAGTGGRQREITGNNG